MAPPGWYDDPVYVDGFEGAPNFWIPDSEWPLEAARTAVWCKEQIQMLEMLSMYCYDYARGARTIGVMRAAGWAQGKGFLKQAISNLVKQPRGYAGYIDALLDSIN